MILVYGNLEEIFIMNIKAVLSTDATFFNSQAEKIQISILTRLLLIIDHLLIFLSSLHSL